ncbi:MAG: HlyD family efflux transporter periplasmic adaptor subunit [Candidatus Sumerlaeia bacterium]|nr:HlyD family efflux transporter periplasmic adaptor subunit [Candidatus Sumerlaeia bacterium]
MGPRLLAAALAAALLASAGCRKDAGADLPTHSVQAGDFVVALEEVGVVEAKRVVNVIAPFSGSVVTLADSGAMVKAGDLVAVLDPVKIREQIDEVIDELKQLKNEYEKSIESMTMEIRSGALEVDGAFTDLDFQRLKLEETNSELSRLQLLRDREVVATDEVRDALSNAALSKLRTVGRERDSRSQQTSAALAESGYVGDIGQTLLNVEKSRRDLEKSLAEFASAQVKAPVDGMFMRRSGWNWRRRTNAELQPGEEIGDGELIGTIPDLSGLVVRTQVPESWLERVREGMEAEVVFDTIGGVRMTGRLERIASAAIERERSASGMAMASESASGERVFEAELAIADPDPQLKPGLTARVRIILSKDGGVVSVPVEAVWTRDGAHWVAERSGGGWAGRKVELGRESGGSVEVLGGLRPGDTILASDPRRVLDGKL